MILVMERPVPMIVSRKRCHGKSTVNGEYFQQIVLKQLHLFFHLYLYIFKDEPDVYFESYTKFNLNGS